MVGRYPLLAYQKSVSSIFPLEKSLFYLLQQTNLVLSRNFKRDSTLCSKGERPNSERNNQQKTGGTICDNEAIKSSADGSVSEYFYLSPPLQNCRKWKEKFVNTMLVYPNFISPVEEETLMKEIEPYISRLHYENSHWDDAIHEYRETERSRWSQKNELIINRIRSLGFPPGVPQLKLVHILDLAKKGIIKPHIDSVRFCGNTIAGLSILSDSIMRLKHDIQRDFFCDVYLPRFSLYVMKDFARYEFTHEILGETESIFKSKLVARDRRISIICRNEPENSPSSDPVFKAMD